MQRPAIELDQFSDLISTVYDCAIDPHLWPTAIEQIARLIDGSGGLILMIDLIENRSRLYVDWNVGAALGQTFSEHYYADNPLNEAFPKFEVDEPYNIAMVMAPERWRETRVYREFGQPNGWLDNVGVNLLKAPARSASLSIVRPEEAGFAGPRELEIMRLLSPHLRRAVSIADLIEMRELTARTFESSFDALAVPIVLVDRAGGIVHANGAAQDVFACGDPVRSERGALKPASTEAAQRLDASIARVAQSRGRKAQAAEVVFVPFADGRPAFAHVLPIRSGAVRRGIEPRAAAMVFIAPAGASAALPLAAWAAAFGLTAAEVRVLELMVGGKTVSDVATSLNVAVTTARTHLVRVMQKTGTRRQADLIRLATQLMAPVR
jgi:DNA-binding CsgD family transcriptional regulator/PAS domain-containing protein